MGKHVSSSSKELHDTADPRAIDLRDAGRRRVAWRPVARALWAVPWLVVAIACGGNTQEQRDAAQKAADAYCGCVKTNGAMAPSALAESKTPCEAEEQAWTAAWSALPKRADGDDKAAAISAYQQQCSKQLLQLRLAAGAAK